MSTNPIYETILYEKEGKIVRLTLNRPEKMNAISVQMRKEMMAAMNEIENDDDVLKRKRDKGSLS